MFSHDGRYLYGSSYYTGVSNIFRYEVATGDVEAVSNAETGFFRPVPLADGRLVVLSYTGDGFVPAIIDPRAARGRERDHASSAPRSPRSTRSSRPGRCRRPSTVDDDEARSSARGPTSRCANVALANALSRCCRATRTTSASATTSTSTTRSASRTSAITAAVHADRRTCRTDERGHVEVDGQLPRLARRRCRGTARTSTTCSVRPSAAARATRRRSATTTCSSSTTPRRLERQARPRVLRQDRHAARTRRTSRRRSTACSPARSGLHYTDVRRSLGAVDDEKGIAWNARRDGQPRRTATPCRRCAAASTSACALPLPQLVDLAAQRRRRRRRRPRQSARELLLRRVRQQLRRQRHRQALPRVRRVPRLRDQRDRRAAASCGRWSSGTCRRCVFESLGTPSLPPHVAAPGGLRLGAVDRSATDSASAQRLRRTSARRSTCASRVLHWYDMTLSVGYAVGFRAAAARRRRVDGVAQDHVSASRCDHRCRRRAGRRCCRCWPSSRRCSSSTATSSSRCASSLVVIGVGAVVAAVAATSLNGALLGRLDIDVSPTRATSRRSSRRSLKGLIVVALIRTHRIGFLVDAAILGFAVGTGFALVENLQYQRLAARRGHRHLDRARLRHGDHARRRRPRSSR